MPSKARIGDPGTRRRILDATWEVFDELGARVRVRDVADRAEVSRQAVYLHFGDRAGLLVALVRHINDRLGLGELEAHILDAPTGEEALVRLIEAGVTFTARIESIAEVFEVQKAQDEALEAAWRDRMEWRRTRFRAVLERVEADGRLAAGWTPATAADLCYASTLPQPVRELTRELGWTPSRYAEHVTTLVRAGLITRVPAPPSLTD